MGLRLRWLGTEAFTWGDLLAIVRQSPATTALYRARYGDDSEWTLTNQLLAIIGDALHNANWMNSADGQKGINRPDPIERPGVRPERENYQSMTVEETLEWLNWKAPDTPAELVEPVKVSRRKLTAEQVREIRSSSETRAALATRYGVAASTVSAAATGKTYQDIN